MTLPAFTVNGTIQDIVSTGSGLTSPVLAATVTFTPNVNTPGSLIVWQDGLYKLEPVVAGPDSSGQIGPVKLLANDSGLNFTGLQWRVEIRNKVGGSVAASWWFDAPADGQTIDLATVAHAPGVQVNAVDAYHRPSTGIPRSDLAASVQTSLGKADTATQPADLAGIVPWSGVPIRNTVAAIGDSLTGRGGMYTTTNTNPYEPWLNMSYLNLLSILTHQRIRWGAGNYAVSGSWVDAQQSEQLPRVLAMNPLPGACILACGGAEMLENSAYSFSTNQTRLKQMVASLQAVGVVPILFVIPPVDGEWGVGSATIKPRIIQWNAWIRRYAATNGFALIDCHLPCAAVDGSRIASTTIDGSHFTGTGALLVAQQALADGLADIFPPNSLVNTARTTNDLTTLFNDGTKNLGVFTTDSNSDGIADGLTATGSPTCSRVTPTTTDRVLGNWQQMVASGVSSLYSYITSGWSPGDTLAFSCRIQTTGMQTAGAQFFFGLIMSTPSGFTLPDGDVLTSTEGGLGNWLAADIPDGELYFEMQIPASATDLKFSAWILSVPAGTVTLRFAEVTIRNLTTGGFLA